MAETIMNQYAPDYLVAPGEVLEDYLEALRMTQAELADRTGLAKKTINEIIKGKSPLTPDTALKLERTLGRPAHFWSNLERQYQEDRSRLSEKDRLQSYLSWLDKVPVKTMTRLGWIPQHTDEISQLEEVLRFFGVASPEQWKTVWEEYQVAYRQTRRFETCAESVSAWLRQGEIEARKMSCAPFDRKRFQAALEGIRSLTREEPRIFQPHIVKLCASAGVSVVFTPELPKTGVCGATRWLSDKALIQLSLRYKSNDQLWFTFFHEAGHIIKHGRKDIFIESANPDGEKEEEADAFARDKLIPPAAFRAFLKGWNRRSFFEIQHFADQVGIAPGIVVGRLQHDGLLLKTHGNKLKVFYRWAGEGTE
jgi:HTH-type transcriptional regulator / antitoxin HigA